MALLKGILGGQADSILASMRSILDKHISQPDFPLPQIIEHYKGKAKDLYFNESYIDRLLDTQHGEGSCRALLHLLFPEMKPTEIFHIDHLHPKKMFEEKELKSQDFLKNDKELFEFYNNPSHWNTISNLHLLNHSQNHTKSDTPLKQWIEDPNVHLSAKDLLVEGVDLDFKEFKAFYEQRRAALKNRLISRVFMSSSVDITSTENDSDEETKDEVV